MAGSSGCFVETRLLEAVAGQGCGAALQLEEVPSLA
jgi:hypothetical protein